MTSTPGPTPPAPRSDAAPASRAPSHSQDAEPPYVERPSAIWKLAQTLVRIWASVWFDLKVYGVRNVPRTGGVLIVSNHQSYLDPPLLGARMPRPMSYMAKSELFKHRLVAWLIRKLGAFPVRQGAGDVRAIKETVSRLQEGRVLNIFPEGTRTETGEIMTLEAGVALVVRKAGVPLIPAAMIGSYEAWPKGWKLFQRHPVRIVFGRPLEVKGMKGEAIIRLIDFAIRKLYDDLRTGRMTDRVAEEPLVPSPSGRGLG